MGQNTSAPGVTQPPTPSQANPGGPGTTVSPIVTPSAPDAAPSQTQTQSPAPEDSGPGTFEDLHKKCKDVFPTPFEGAKLLINKGLSNHFQISHTLTMSSLSPSGYRFGCTYVGTQMAGPMESYPILVGDMDPSGDLNAQIIHQVFKQIRCKFVSQIQGGKWLATQLTSDYRGDDMTASVTIGNPDLINGSGVIVSQYLQNVTKQLALGAELLYQCGPNVPGNQIAIYTLAGRYTSNDWTLSSNITPMAGGVHLCYHHKANDSLAIACELEGSVRTKECTATVGYQLDLPTANLLFRGQVDSNWCVGAVMEKRLPPLPFTFALSAFANHAKGAYRFGVGLIVG